MSSNPLMETAAAAAELGAASSAPATAGGNRRRLNPAVLAALGCLLLLLACGSALACFLAMPNRLNSADTGSNDTRGGAGQRRLLLAQVGGESQPQSRCRDAQFAEFALDTSSSTSSCPAAGGSNTNSYPCWLGADYLAFTDLGRLRQLDGGDDSFSLTNDRRRIRLPCDGVFAFDAQVRVRFDSGNLALQGHLDVNGQSSKLYCDERVVVEPSQEALKQNALTITCRLSGLVRLRAGDLVATRLELFKAKVVLTQPDSTFIRLVRLR